MHGIADRFLYIPAIGIYSALVFQVADAAGRGIYRKAAIAVSLPIFLLMVISVRGQVKYWRDNITLFSRAVQVTRWLQFVAGWGLVVA